MLYRNKIYIFKNNIYVWHTTYNVTLVCVRIHKIIIILNKNCVYYLIYYWIIKCRLLLSMVVFLMFLVVTSIQNNNYSTNKNYYRWVVSVSFIIFWINYCFILNSLSAYVFKAYFFFLAYKFFNFKNID